jgi:hypothetical protein
MNQTLDVETGDLIALPPASDPLAAELLHAVERMLAALPGRRDALMRYAYSVRNKAWKERMRLYRQTEDHSAPVIWDGHVVAYQPASEAGVIIDQWNYLQTHQDAPQAEEWLVALQTNWRRYGALCEALEATRAVL